MCRTGDAAAASGRPSPHATPFAASQPLLRRWSTSPCTSSAEETGFETSYSSPGLEKASRACASQSGEEALCRPGRGRWERVSRRRLFSRLRSHRRPQKERAGKQPRETTLSIGRLVSQRVQAFGDGAATRFNCRGQAALGGLRLLTIADPVPVPYGAGYKVPVPYRYLGIEYPTWVFRYWYPVLCTYVSSLYRVLIPGTCTGYHHIFRCAIQYGYLYG